MERVFSDAPWEELVGYCRALRAGDRIYVTCYSGYGTGDRNAGMDDLRLHVVCLDRAKGAIDSGTPILAGDLELTLKIPDWATFDWPETSAETA